MAGPPDTARLSFEPDAYRAVRHEGADAYRTFLGAIENSTLPIPYPKVEYPPLRTLACLGWNATSPEDSQVFLDSELGGPPIPAEAPLRDWYSRYEEDFNSFFPEHRSGVSNLPEDWGNGDPSLFWQQLEHAVDGFARERGLRRDCIVGFYILVRDHVEALAPLGERLRFKLGEVTLVS